MRKKPQVNLSFYNFLSKNINWRTFLMLCTRKMTSKIESSNFGSQTSPLKKKKQSSFPLLHASRNRHSYFIEIYWIFCKNINFYLPFNISHVFFKLNLMDFKWKYHKLLIEKGWIAGVVLIKRRSIGIHKYKWNCMMKVTRSHLNNDSTNIYSIRLGCHLFLIGFPFISLVLKRINDS